MKDLTASGLASATGNSNLYLPLSSLGLRAFVKVFAPEINLRAQRSVLRLRLSSAYLDLRTNIRAGADTHL